MNVHLLILALIFATLKLDAQVYAVGPGPNRGPLTTLRVDEHRWMIRSFGVVQFRARSGEDTPWVRQTTIHLGARSFTARMPVVSIVTIPALVAAILLLLPLSPARSRAHFALSANAGESRNKAAPNPKGIVS